MSPALSIFASSWSHLGSTLVSSFEFLVTPLVRGSSLKTALPLQALSGEKLVKRREKRVTPTATTASTPLVFLTPLACSSSLLVIPHFSPIRATNFDEPAPLWHTEGMKKPVAARTARARATRRCLWLPQIVPNSDPAIQTCCSERRCARACAVSTALPRPGRAATVAAPAHTIAQNSTTLLYHTCVLTRVEAGPWGQGKRILIRTPK